MFRILFLDIISKKYLYLFFLSAIILFIFIFETVLRFKYYILNNYYFPFNMIFGFVLVDYLRLHNKNEFNLFLKLPLTKKELFFKKNSLLMIVSAFSLIIFNFLELQKNENIQSDGALYLIMYPIFIQSFLIYKDISIQKLSKINKEYIINLVSWLLILVIYFSSMIYLYEKLVSENNNLIKYNSIIIINFVLLLIISYISFKKRTSLKI